MKKIVIDAGHGGNDPGASKNDIVEKDLTLKISKYMKNRFDELGIENSITRTDDITLNPTDRVNKILGYYGNGNDVIVLSNHINAGGGDGFEIVYALRNNDTLSKKITKEIEETGQNVRTYYQRRLPSNSSKDYYYIMRDTPNTEAVLIEYGFLDSTKDDVEQLKNNYKELAEAVVKAVANYINVPYTSPNTSKDYYIVQKGDSLWSISKKYNLSVDELKDINNLNSNLLSIGQKLLINNNEKNDYYIVKKGDTLYQIAKNNNTTVNEIIELNKLPNSNLSIGQKLLIPSSEKVYIVQKGDTLYQISKKYNVPVDVIMTKNKLNTTVLSIGQKLLV